MARLSVCLFRRACVLVSLAVLASCTSKPDKPVMTQPVEARTVVLKDGRQLHYILCRHRVSACYAEARKLCAGSYTVISDEQIAKMRVSHLTGPNGIRQPIVEGRNIFELIVECR